jgi:Fuc2NAc and GlcNAc transferase
MSFYDVTLIFLLCYGLTGIYRIIALKKNILDIPISRSMHVLPTPRGGGIGFVITIVICTILYSKKYIISSNFLNVILQTCLGVSILGLIDDKYNLSAKLRLIIQFLLGGLILLNYPFVIFQYTDYLIFQIMIVMLFIFSYLWVVNLYNFMDGINGLATLEAISVCLCMLINYYLIDYYQDFNFILIVIFSLMGFLIWNFPKAKIFMGDAGSYFLGSIIFILSIVSLNKNVTFFFSWIIIFAVFFVDATSTLIRRLLNKENLFQAHKKHIYQIVSMKYNSHVKASLSIILINFLWLFPISYLVMSNKINVVYGLILAYFPLLAIDHFYKERI